MNNLQVLVRCYDRVAQNSGFLRSPLTSGVDAVDRSHHRHLDAKMRLLLRNGLSLLMAKNGLSDHVVASSALPPGADIPVASAELPLLTISESVRGGLHRRAPVPLKFSTRLETDRGRQRPPPPPRSNTPALDSQLSIRDSGASRPPRQ
jgi:hypothetical protein